MLTQLPAEMLMEMAMGLGDPIAIASRYGYDQNDYIRMSTQPWFHREIDRLAKELEANGFTVKQKMASLAEDLLIDTYRAAKSSDSVALRLDVAKYLSKIGGLEPQPGVQAAGAGFSLTINLSGQNGGAWQAITIEANQPSEYAETIDAPRASVDELPLIAPGAVIDVLPLPTYNLELGAHE